MRILKIADIIFLLIKLKKKEFSIILLINIIIAFIYFIKIDKLFYVLPILLLSYSNILSVSKTKKDLFVDGFIHLMPFKFLVFILTKLILEFLFFFSQNILLAIFFNINLNFTLITTLMVYIIILLLRVLIRKEYARI